MNMYRIGANTGTGHRTYTLDLVRMAILYCEDEPITGFQEARPTICAFWKYLAGTGPWMVVGARSRRFLPR